MNLFTKNATTRWHHWLLTLTLSVLCASVQAQTGGGVIIEEGEAQSGKFNLSEYLNINAIVGASSGSGLNRDFYHIRIGGQYTTGPVSFFGNVLVSELTAELTLDLEEYARTIRDNCIQSMDSSDYCDEYKDLTDEITYEFKYDATELDELYLTYNITDAVSLTVGQSRITLGQFAFVSPVHVLLPISSEQQLGFSKVDQRVPQPLLELKIFPLERLQLQFVYIPNTRLDNAQEEYFDLSFRGEALNSDNYTTEYAPGYDSSQDGAEVFAEYDQQLLRALYTPDWGVVGLSIWSGPVHFTTLEFDTVICTDNDKNYCEETLPRPVGTPGTLDYTRQVAPGLPDANAFALEIAVNTGNWTLIGELVMIQDTAFSMHTVHNVLSEVNKPCGNIGNQAASIPPTTDTVCDKQVEDAQLFLETLADTNQGRGYLSSNLTLMALGADGRSSDGTWNYNLQLLFFSVDLPSDSAQVLDALSALTNSFDYSWSDNIDTITGSAVFPTFHLSKTHQIAQRPAIWGMGLGFFLQYGGIFSYYKVDVTDNFSIQGGLELLERVSEQQSSSENNPEYDLPSTSAALSLALQLTF